jgi:hypothetical protein
MPGLLLKSLGLAICISAMACGMAWVGIKLDPSLESKLGVMLCYLPVFPAHAVTQYLKSNMADTSDLHVVFGATLVMFWFCVVLGVEGGRIWVKRHMKS